MKAAGEISLIGVAKYQNKLSAGGWLGESGAALGMASPSASASAAA